MRCKFFLQDPSLPPRCQQRLSFQALPNPHTAPPEGISSLQGRSTAPRRAWAGKGLSQQMETTLGRMHSVHLCAQALGLLVSSCHP